jgi:hypothetical protein
MSANDTAIVTGKRDRFFQYGSPIVSRYIIRAPMDMQGSSPWQNSALAFAQAFSEQFELARHFWPSSCCGSPERPKAKGLSLCPSYLADSFP